MSAACTFRAAGVATGHVTLLQRLCDLGVGCFLVVGR